MNAKHSLPLPCAPSSFLGLLVSILILVWKYHTQLITPLPSHPFGTCSHRHNFCLICHHRVTHCTCKSCLFVISACGMNFAYSGQITALNQYFYKRHSIATSMAMLGIGLGMFFLVRRKKLNEIIFCCCICKMKREQFSFSLASFRVIYMFTFNSFF